MYKHSSVVSKLPRKILYRKGDLDAFLAAYVYWVYFGTVTGQEYLSVDPMDQDFKTQLHAPFQIGDIETNYEHEYVVSIGANLEKVSFYTRLYAFENSKTFDYRRSDEYSFFYVDHEQSLLGLLCHKLMEDGHMSPSDSKFKSIRQLLKLETVDGKLVPDPQICAEICAIVPELRPCDFPVLNELISQPSNLLSSRNLKRDTHTRVKVQLEEFEKAKAKSTVLKWGNGQDLVVFNTPLHNHPLCHEMLSDETRPVLACLITNDRVVGQVFAPRSRKISAFDLFPRENLCGNDERAFFSAPRHTVSLLFGRT